MLRQLEELRKQPKPVKDRVAFLAAAVICSIIVIVWVVSIPAQFSNIPDVAVSTDDESGSFARAFDDLGAQMANVMGGLEEAFNEPFATGTTPVPGDESPPSGEFNLQQMFATNTPSGTEGESAEPVPTAPSSTTSSSATAGDNQPSTRTILIATSSAVADPEQ